MAIPLSTRLTTLALKAETTVGTAVSLVAADADFKAYDAELKLNRATAERMAQASGGQDIGIAEESSVELNFSLRAAGKGAVGIPTWASKLFPASGFLATSQTYARTWVTSNFASLSAAKYVNGVKVLGRGIFVNQRWTYVPGKMTIIEVNGMGGAVANPSDAAILTGMTYDDVKPPIWVPGAGNALTIDSLTIFKPSQLVVDFGNVLSLRSDANSFGGNVSGWVDEGAATFTLDPEGLLRASFDWGAKQSTNATFPISIVLDGGANNTITHTATVQVKSAPEWGERGRKMTENVVLQEVSDSHQVVFA